MNAPPSGQEAAKSTWYPPNGLEKLCVVDFVVRGVFKKTRTVESLPDSHLDVYLGKDR